MLCDGILRSYTTWTWRGELLDTLTTSNVSAPELETEITAMSDRYDEFEDLDAEVIGVSTDTIHTHLAWINTDRTQNGLGDLVYPLAADTNHQVSKDYGVLIEEEGIALRGLFIINPEGELQYQTVFHNNIGRDVDETLRVLQALQTGGLCPANWRPGQATL